MAGRFSVDPAGCWKHGYPAPAIHRIRILNSVVGIAPEAAIVDPDLKKLWKTI
jgi:hypothetical protein